ncbi:hypothetical protein EI94DRAFT_1701750 [Lactarius quietus]|nr:hypothetical protein EI94DRAFT_1701750 [Lactarius quietus]
MSRNALAVPSLAEAHHHELLLLRKHAPIKSSARSALSVSAIVKSVADSPTEIRCRCMAAVWVKCFVGCVRIRPLHGVAYREHFEFGSREKTATTSDVHDVQQREWGSCHTGSRPYRAAALARALRDTRRRCFIMLVRVARGLRSAEQDDENVATVAKLVRTRLRSGARQKAPRSSNTGKALIFSDFRVRALALQLACLHRLTEHIGHLELALRVLRRGASADISLPSSSSQTSANATLPSRTRFIDVRRPRISDQRNYEAHSSSTAASEPRRPLRRQCRQGAAQSGHTVRSGSRFRIWRASGGRPARMEERHRFVKVLMPRGGIGNVSLAIARGSSTYRKLLSEAEAEERYASYVIVRLGRGERDGMTIGLVFELFQVSVTALSCGGI